MIAARRTTECRDLAEVEMKFLVYIILIQSFLIEGWIGEVLIAAICKTDNMKSEKPKKNHNF